MTQAFSGDGAAQWLKGDLPEAAPDLFTAAGRSPRPGAAARTESP
ncbi:hypothetical protein [Streptomyces sp. CRN 30]|nr:hypothetical protein [Streptomyces sp. CRN 30]